MIQDFNQRVAVITEVGSNIGRAFANYCAMEKISVLLADDDQAVLGCAERELQERGATVSTLQVDLSKVGGVQALALVALDTYGHVDLFFNHADMFNSGSIDWESSYASNLWGMVQNLRVFVPIMLTQNVPCFIVNTAPLAGYLSFSPGVTCQVTEYATAGPTWIVTPKLAVMQNQPINSCKKSDEQAHAAHTGLYLFDGIQSSQPSCQTAGQIISTIAEVWSGSKLGIEPRPL